MSLKDGSTVGVATQKNLGGINMKKEELIALGIDEETAKKVMAEHGKTVTSLNQQLSAAEGERDTLQTQLTANQTELNTLKESAKDNKELSENYAELQKKFDAAASDASKQKKEFAIKLALKDSGTYDETMLMQQLDHELIKVSDEGIQGLDEQIKNLRETKPFLFPEKKAEPTPKIVTSGNASGGGQATQEEKMAEALGLKKLGGIK